MANMAIIGIITDIGMRSAVVGAEVALPAASIVGV